MRIQLSNGMTALIDDEDAIRVCYYINPWGASEIRQWHYDGRYATANDRGRGNKLYLHRFIMGLRKGDKRVVDHMNENPLDCRKSNLEVKSQAEHLKRHREMKS